MRSVCTLCPFGHLSMSFSVPASPGRDVAQPHSRAMKFQPVDYITSRLVRPVHNGQYNPPMMSSTLVIFPVA